MLVVPHAHVFAKSNNFDLIRLLAAAQVFLTHLEDHLKLAVPSVITFLPGVWIFFIVSGFLVTGSLARCQSLGEYFRHRAVRIYPALWAMTGVTLALLAVFGQLNAGAPLLKLAGYVLGQATFFQVVSSGLGMFRGFGTGAVNGVLWTVATEIQFYLCLPLIFWFVARFPGRRLLVLGVLFCVSALVYELELPLWVRTATAQGAALDLHRELLTIGYTSIVTHLFGFLFGVLFYLELPRLYRFVDGKFWLWLIGYCGFVLVVGNGLGLAGWNLERNAAVMICERVLLAGLVFSFAFSCRGLADRILHRNDISYGVYIYHMLVINTLIQLGLIGSWRYGALAIATVAAAAIGSWRIVEKPAFRLKSRTAGPA